MPDRTTLHVGDKISILYVPDADLKQREKGSVAGDDMLPTATALEKVIDQYDTVTIDQIDEYGQPWFSADIEVNGETEHHTFAIMDDESWEIVSRKPPSKYQARKAEIKQKIDAVMKEFDREYQALADKSETLSDQQERLKKEYEELDKKTGLNALYEEGYYLKMKYQRSARDNFYWALISAFIYFWLCTFISGELFTPPWALIDGVAFGFAWGAGINTIAAYVVGAIIIIAVPIVVGFLGSKLLKRVHMIRVKMIRYLLLALIAVIAMIALAGIYKFNYLASQHGYDVDGNKIVSQSQGQETIYFSESAGTWLDDAGICHTCTPENGFGADGSVGNIIWRELVVSLKNDLGESPSVQEVKTLMEDSYADLSSGYPVHIYKEKDNFTIITPVPKELRDIDFLDRRGVLRATYDIVQK